MVLKSFLLTHLPFPVDLLPLNSYLVGGAVRDVLLQRHRGYWDLDLVLPHSVLTISRHIANFYGAGFVVLDRERQITRVVFPNATVDFAQMVGNSILEDLGRRDYTLNAIALHCQEFSIVDPYNGQEDLIQGKIKMINDQNLMDDPLRLMRAYRFASQLNFTIEDRTRETIKSLKGRLNEVAMERVNYELSYLISHENSGYWLHQILEDELLVECFPSLSSNALVEIKKIESFARWMRSKWQNFTPQEFWYSSAILACLTNPNPDTAESELINLKYSRHQIKAVTTILQYTSSLNFEEEFTEVRSQSVPLASQYFFFQSVGNNFPSVALYALAHEIPEDLIIMLMNRYLDPNDLIAHPQPLLTGKEVINILKIKPSPMVGKLLTELYIAQIEGKINNIQQAITWLKIQPNNL